MATQISSLHNILPSSVEERRAILIYLARFAENTERYVDMCYYMKELVHDVYNSEVKPEITVEERNLLSIGYKNVVGARRSSWRQLPEVHEEEYTGMLEYRRHVEDELKESCLEIIALLEDCLLRMYDNVPPDHDIEARVFYLKMAGDYYRYLAEICPKSNGYHEKAASFYRLAFNYARGFVEGCKGLSSTHPIRLGLALNYSVCYYEILEERQKACDLAKVAWDDAIPNLDELGETSYKDAVLILGLLRDNLTLWTSEFAREADLERNHGGKNQFEYAGNNYDSSDCE